MDAQAASPGTPPSPPSPHDEELDGYCHRDPVVPSAQGSRNEWAKLVAEEPDACGAAGGDRAFCPAPCLSPFLFEISRFWWARELGSGIVGWMPSSCCSNSTRAEVWKAVRRGKSQFTIRDRFSIREEVLGGGESCWNSYTYVSHTPPCGANPTTSGRTYMYSRRHLRLCIFTKSALSDLRPSYEQTSCLPIDFGGRRKLSSDVWKLEDTSSANLFPNL